jgi:hypothetical protein
MVCNSSVPFPLTPTLSPTRGSYVSLLLKNLCTTNFKKTGGSSPSPMGRGSG